MKVNSHNQNIKSYIIHPCSTSCLHNEVIQDHESNIKFHKLLPSEGIPPPQYPEHFTCFSPLFQYSAAQLYYVTCHCQTASSLSITMCTYSLIPCLTVTNYRFVELFVNCPCNWIKMALNSHSALLYLRVIITFVSPSNLHYSYILCYNYRNGSKSHNLATDSFKLFKFNKLNI